jgi:hypothetical protein
MTDEELAEFMQGKTPEELTPPTESWSDEELLKKFPALAEGLGPRVEPKQYEETGARGAAIGAFKQGALDLLTLGQGVRQAIPSPFREAISPDPAQNIARATYRGYTPGGEYRLFDRNGRFQRAMDWPPRGPAEELGAEGMKVGEALIGPRGALNRIGVPMFGPVKPGAITQLAKAGARAGIPPIATRSASEGAWQGLVSAIQGDEPGEAAKWGAGVSALTDATMGRLSRFAPVLEEKAIRTYGRMFDPKTKRETARARQAAEWMYEKGGGAITRGSLARKAQSNIERLAREKVGIEGSWGRMGPGEKWLNLDDINNQIEDFRRKRLTTTVPGTNVRDWKNPNFGPHVSDVLDKIKDGLNNLSVQGPQGGRVINYVNAEDIKRDMQLFLDKFGYFAEKGGKDIQTAAQQLAQEMGYRALMRAFSRETPDVAEVNAAMAHWLTVRNSILGISEKTFGRPNRMLGGVIMPGSQGNMVQRITKSGQYGFLVGSVNSLLNTPAWLTMTAKMKGELADLLSKGSVEGLRAFMSTVAAQTQSDPRFPEGPTVSESRLPPPGKHIWTPGGYVPAPTDQITTGTAEEEMLKSAPKTGNVFATPGGGTYLRDPTAPLGWRESEKVIKDGKVYLRGPNGELVEAR